MVNFSWSILEANLNFLSALQEYKAKLCIVIFLYACTYSLERNKNYCAAATRAHRAIILIALQRESYRFWWILL